MTGNRRRRRPFVVGRLTAMLAGVVTLLALVAPAAHAAAPGNDDIDNAVVVSTIPYTATTQTSEATVGEGDSGCGLATVWYEFTPAVSGSYSFNTFGSDYDTTLAVFEGSPGSLNPLGCNDDALGLVSAVMLDLTGGATYYIEVGTCCGPGQVGQVGPGGSLVLNVDVSPPPFSVELTVDERVLVGSTPGTATVSGTVTCNQIGFVDIYGELRQKQGLNVVSGGFYVNSECSTTTTTWTATVDAGSRVFLPKKATLRAEASGCGFFSCDSDAVTRTVKVTRK